MIADIDCCRLAGILMQVSIWSTEEDIWEQLEIEYGIEPDSFVRLINKLVPMIDYGESGTTGKTYKGFSVAMNEGLSRFIVKTEILTQ